MVEALMCVTAVAVGTAASALLLTLKLQRALDDLEGRMALNSARLMALESESMSLTRDVKANGHGLGVVARDLSDLRKDLRDHGVKAEVLHREG